MDWGGERELDGAARAGGDGDSRLASTGYRFYAQLEARALLAPSEADRGDQTVRPMSSRWPGAWMAADVRRGVPVAVPGRPLIALVAVEGSPSAVPAGMPNAATLAGVSTRATTGVGEGEGGAEGVADGGAAGALVAAFAVPTAAGWDWTGRGVVAAAGCRSRPTPATNL